MGPRRLLSKNLYPLTEAGRKRFLACPAVSFRLFLIVPHQVVEYIRHMEQLIDCARKAVWNPAMGGNSAPTQRAQGQS